MLYFQFDENAQCVSLHMMRIDRVAEQQPSPVRIYDYYEPSKHIILVFMSVLFETDLSWP